MIGDALWYSIDRPDAILAFVTHQLEELEANKQRHGQLLLAASSGSSGSRGHEVISSPLSPLVPVMKQQQQQPPQQLPQTSTEVLSSPSSLRTDIPIPLPLQPDRTTQNNGAVSIHNNSSSNSYSRSNSYISNDEYTAKYVNLLQENICEKNSEIKSLTAEMGIMTDRLKSLESHNFRLQKELELADSKFMNNTHAHNCVCIWYLLKDEINSVSFSELHKFLEEIGLSSSQDVMFFGPEEIKTIASMLKPLQKNKFLSILKIINASFIDNTHVY